jgi:hypothetical protein
MPAVDLMYAAKYASTANGWKYYIGQTRGLKRLNVKDDKAKIEKEFTTWMNAKDERKQKYGEALPMIQQYYSEWDPNVLISTYANLTGVGGAEFMGLAAGLGDVIKAALAEKDEAKRKEQLDALKPDIDAFFKEYNAGADKLVFYNLTNLYRTNVTTNRASWHTMLDTKFKGNVRAFTEKLFATSIFTDKARMMAFLAKPNAKALDKDLGYIAASSAMKQTQEVNAKNPAEKLGKGMRLFVAGLREMNPSKAYAPDANSTMRLTYGKVLPYSGGDAINYDYVTTTTGIMEKRDNTNPEFEVPDRLADLITNKDFGKYAKKGDDLVTCFLTDHDITGGNSGSPVIDGDGNLIGIAFDGNWEAMSGDIAFENKMQRTISVDIRYVLFTVEKLMGGRNIIDELKFVKKATKPAVATPADASSQVPAVLSPSGNTTTPATAKPSSPASTDAKKKAEETKAKAEADAKARKAEFEKNKKEAEKKQADAKKKAEEMKKDAKVAPAPAKK